MVLFDIIFITCVTTLAMLVWFKSDAFIEYARLVGGAKFFGIVEYEELRKENASLDYHGYLARNKDNFFIRLIICPLCLSVWLTLLTTSIRTDSIILFPICNLTALISYKLISNLLDS